MADKPASRPFAKGLARGDGFVGQFALPGLVPELVQRAGTPQKFSSEAAAQAAAAMALVDKLAFRVSQPNRAKEYARISGAELGVILAEADVAPSAFARLYGVPRDRVLKWLGGEQEIPHSAHVLARLLEDEHVKAKVEALTAIALEEGQLDER